jgi:hypothetical protein
MRLVAGAGAPSVGEFTSVSMIQAVGFVMTDKCSEGYLGRDFLI